MVTFCERIMRIPQTGKKHSDIICDKSNGQQTMWRD